MPKTHVREQGDKQPWFPKLEQHTHRHMARSLAWTEFRWSLMLNSKLQTYLSRPLAFELSIPLAPIGMELPAAQLCSAWVPLVFLTRFIILTWLYLFSDWIVVI